MRQAIRKQLRNFVAVAALMLIALFVTGYILANQRFDLPGWVPLVGKDYYTIKADFNTGQAVVPGQGQTVDVAGVPVGQIGGVELKNGVAQITLEIKKKYAPVYRDATMLLRPKTGLKDMIVEMDPGNASAGKVPEGGTIPVGNTAPDVNPDEILANLDADTRTYLAILLNAGGQAFSHGAYVADLRETFKRFEPTNRSLAKITGELSTRRQNIAHVNHNLRLLMEELGTKDKQIASLVDTANANFRALAHQDSNIRASLQLLPDTLRTAQTTLGKADNLARHLGPT
ncbi:MAG: phospholipid/cholesterol/gamma-HCH transport system substrate-binding protein, partial [Thermoleophilaceae bacterium]|nr:phospholipid/cholesterol/gamma-HCH transport system substrate-binding protein [Thermoleophilaceae bacterium]